MYVMEPCQLRLAPSGRWILVNPENPQLAWSGSQWVPHSNGVAADLAVIRSFGTLEELSAYVREHDLELDHGS